MQNIDSKINNTKFKIDAIEALRGFFCLLTLYLAVGTDCLFTFRGFNLFALQKAQAQSPYLRYLYVALILAMGCVLAATYYYAMRVRQRFSIVWQFLLTLYGACAMLFCVSYNAFLPLMISRHVLSKITWFTMARYSPVMFWLVIAAFKLGCLIMDFASASALHVKCLILAICGAALLLASYKCTALKVWLDGVVAPNDQAKTTCIGSAAVDSSLRRFWPNWLTVAVLLMAIVFTGHLSVTIEDWLRMSDLSFVKWYGLRNSTISIYSIILMLFAVLPVYHFSKKNGGYKILAAVLLGFVLWILSIQFQCKMMGSATILNVVMALARVINILCLLELARLSFVSFIVGDILVGMQGIAHFAIGRLLTAGGFTLLWRSYFVVGAMVLAAVVVMISMEVVLHDNDDNEQKGGFIS